jgi:2,3-dihydroxybenzoate decarboxylase
MPAGYKRIATEEAWAPAELLDTYRSMASRKSIDDPGFIVLWNRLGARAQLSERLADIGERRIADMDSSGIDLQILSLTSPGVQVFDAATATSLAVTTNDQVAEAVRKYPTRFAALGAVAPQDPQGAAREAERAVRTLGLKGIIINSHTRGEFLDRCLRPTSRKDSKGRCGDLVPRRASTCSQSCEVARSTVSPASASSSATPARPCRSGSIVSTT